LRTIGIRAFIRQPLHKFLYPIPYNKSENKKTKDCFILFSFIIFKSLFFVFSILYGTWQRKVCHDLSKHTRELPIKFSYVLFLKPLAIFSLANCSHLKKIKNEIPQNKMFKVAGIYTVKSANYFSIHTHTLRKCVMQKNIITKS